VCKSACAPEILYMRMLLQSGYHACMHASIPHWAECKDSLEVIMEVIQNIACIISGVHFYTYHRVVPSSLCLHLCSEGG